MNWLLLFVPDHDRLGSPVSRALSAYFCGLLPRHPAVGRMDRAGHGAARGAPRRRCRRAPQATFGNAAELIIALAALRAGLYDVVKASIAGSIIGNILLVLGAAMLCGGLRRPGAALQSGRRAVPGDDADARGDRIDTSGGLSSRGAYDRGGTWPIERRDRRRAPLRLSVEPVVRPGHPCRAVQGLSYRRGAGATSIRGARRSGACRCHGGHRLDERDHGGGDRTDGA